MEKIKEMLGICSEDGDAQNVAQIITSQSDAQSDHTDTAPYAQPALEHTAPPHHPEEHEKPNWKLSSTPEGYKRETERSAGTDPSNRESEESKEEIRVLYKKLAHLNAGLGGVGVVPEQRHGLFA